MLLKYNSKEFNSVKTEHSRVHAYKIQTQKKLILFCENMYI